MRRCVRSGSEVCAASRGRAREVAFASNEILETDGADREGRYPRVDGLLPLLWRPSEEDGWILLELRGEDGGRLRGREIAPSEDAAGDPRLAGATVSRWRSSV